MRTAECSSQGWLAGPAPTAGVLLREARSSGGERRQRREGRRVTAGGGGREACFERRGLRGTAVLPGGRGRGRSEMGTAGMPAGACCEPYPNGAPRGPWGKVGCGWSGETDTSRCQGNPGVGLTAGGAVSSAPVSGRVPVGVRFTAEPIEHSSRNSYGLRRIPHTRLNTIDAWSRQRRVRPNRKRPRWKRECLEGPWAGRRAVGRQIEGIG